MRQILHIFCLLLTFVFVVGCAPCLSQQSAGDGEINLKSKTTEGVPIEVVITLDALSEKYWNQNSWHWGTEFKKPKATISKMSVKYDGVKVFVPFSAFSDLANSREATISVSGKEYAVEIKGGDAATSYTAVIQFDGLNTKSRKVTHGEFQNIVWEETVYSFHERE
jgi:hypothetical protein